MARLRGIPPRFRGNSLRVRGNIPRRLGAIFWFLGAIPRIRRTIFRRHKTLPRVPKMVPRFQKMIFCRQKMEKNWWRTGFIRPAPPGKTAAHRAGQRTLQRQLLAPVTRERAAARHPARERAGGPCRTAVPHTVRPPTPARSPRSAGSRVRSPSLANRTASRRGTGAASS